MLDFYVIPDSSEKPKPEDLENLEYAGGLELSTYNRLVRKGLIDSRFDFYSDFRWGSRLLRHMESSVQDFENDTDAGLLKRIIEKAISRRSGLMAIGD